MESKKKMLFIFNPFSGKAQIKSKLFEIIDVFVKGGYEVIVHPTQAVGDGFEKTKELAPQVDLVVCSGGDGTLDEVVSGLMEVDQRVPIGYIPAGSTNDFANSLFSILVLLFFFSSLLLFVRGLWLSLNIFS